jgi:hypothetical protein
MTIYDYLVVGSGCSGAMAAQTLVEANVKVTMFDVGVEDKIYDKIIPDKDYITLRKTEDEQYKYLIGEKGEGLKWGKVGKGAQITPPRMYMTDLTNKYLPLKATDFLPLESLGYGGLGIGWGLQCWEYSNADLSSAGLDIHKIRQAYDVVSGRIGISATKDAAADYTIGDMKTYQPSANADRNHLYIQEKYDKHINNFRSNGVYIGRTPLALITKDFNGRKGYRYRDMDYYSNNGKSAWRPAITVDNLRKKSNFTYVGSCLVTDFSEKKDLVIVSGINIKTNKSFSVGCRKLVLASGAIGSARIVLRSLGKDSDRLPILSNPHSYIPCVQPTMLGKGLESKRLGFGQLSYFIDKVGDDAGLSVASSYSYQSLMSFRLLNNFPLNMADARNFIRYLTPSLIIMIVQHPDTMSSKKYLKLVPAPDSPTKDKLETHYSLDDNEEETWRKRDKQYASLMRKFRTYAVKRIPTEHGSSIHYAGSLAFSKTKKEFSLSPSGRLHGTKNVYVADSSGFNYLPAKGLTFTLMANAHITAENVLNNL